VLERPLRLLAIALSLIVAIGFTLFALEDFDRASAATEHRIASSAVASPTPAGERERERRHGDVRELIDDANDVLLSPFAGLTENDKSRWMQRGIPALLGLLVYGFGLGYLARFTTARGGSPRRTRTA
jgi:hypothetical protein